MSFGFGFGVARRTIQAGGRALAGLIALLGADNQPLISPIDGQRLHGIK